MGFTIRDFADVDEPSWLRCRVLSFLGSSYYDDVAIARTSFPGQAIRLVAAQDKPEGMTTPGDQEVIGILDVELWEEGGASVATIDTVAVHPDHQRSGIAGALLRHAVATLAGHGVRWLDAWTREDPASNAWYAAQGFALDQTYLHVYKDDAAGDPDHGHTAPFGLAAPVKAFFHGPDEDPGRWRERFARVHQCRRYLRDLDDRSSA